MQKIYDKCCGIDVHKKLSVVCFKHRNKQEIKEYGATTKELLTPDFSTYADMDLGSPDKPILHYHRYNPLFSKTKVGGKELRGAAVKLPGGMKKKLRRYFKGVKL